MEVAIICLNDANLELAGIIDDAKDKQGKKILGFNIQGSEVIKSLNPEAILVTSIRYKDKILNNLKQNKELNYLSFYSL